MFKPIRGAIAMGVKNKAGAMHADFIKVSTYLDFEASLDADCLFEGDELQVLGFSHRLAGQLTCTNIETIAQMNIVD